MKIFYPVLSVFPSEKASSNQIARMAYEFTAIGNSVTILSPYHKSQTSPNNIKWYKTFSESYNHVVLGNKNFLHAKFLPNKFSFYVQNIYFIFCLYLFLRKKQDIILITRDPLLSFLFKKLNINTFYECHDWFPRLSEIKVMMCKRLNGIITTNKYIENEFIKLDIDKNKIICAPNAVDVSTFDINFDKKSAVKKLSLDNTLIKTIYDKKIIMYTGSFMTMEVDKGINDILYSLTYLDDRYFFIAVGGADRHISYYSEKADKYGVSDRVSFLGRYSQSELALWQKIADVLVMPFPNKAHYKYHMSPLKTFEYLISKRPIIASKLPSLQEIIPDNMAFWCNPDDPKNLSEIIINVFNDYNESLRISNRAYLFGIKNTWRKRAELIDEFIQKNI